MMRLLIILGEFILLLFVPLFVYPQCGVTHLNGMANVNGTNVTVTSSGAVDTFSYCQGILSPYYIGVHYTPLPFSCETGSYSFVFSPPVNEIYLNFGGVNSDPSLSEIIRIYINGSHYPLTIIGDTLPCQQLAILTSDGDIASPNWNIAGWKGTKITGVISTLTVQDSVIDVSGGCPNGSVFSLSLCNWAVGTSDIEIEENKVKVFPNPTNGDINIFASEMLTNGSLKVINITGEPVLEREGLNGMSFSFDLSGKADGVYFIEIKTNKGIKRMKLVKQ